ncbi:MAG: Gfo/Idh/MocA family oxidoreductase [Propionibacteriaceae bacterium]|nr:Gfo/Idh/MocA family oxidoreductase [Propionibacteriaceae bacterium]
MSDGIPTLALVGVGGFGRQHMINIERLVRAGKARLAALVSGSGVEQLRGEVAPEVMARAESVEVHRTVDDLLAAGPAPTVVIISTPIHTHTDLTVKALAAGAHVLLEKPPTPGLADFERLMAASAETGRIVQVGFQSFGSHALPRLAGLIAAGEIGDLHHVGGIGTWSRSVGYFTRSGWAGKRMIGDIPVVDGVVTNPLAHAVATALKTAGATRVSDVATVTLDQYRANRIECDDTSAVLVRTSEGKLASLGLTLASPVQTEPRIVVYGSRGVATLHYTTDVLEVTVDGRTTTGTFGRTNLTENLLDHLADPAIPLLCTLADTGAFTAVLDAVRTAPDPRPVAERFVSWHEHDNDIWGSIADVGHYCHQVAEQGRSFAELGAPWATGS